MTDATPPPSASQAKRIIRELFCAAIWLYVIVKLFIFDLDVFLIQEYLPGFNWLISFKFFVIALLVSTYWITVGDKNFFKALVFLAVYPLFLVFWRIPKAFLRDWNAAFVALGFALSFFKSLKVNFFAFSVVSTASLIVLVSDDWRLLTLAITLLMVFIVYHFARRFYTSFIPSKALSFPRDGLINLLEGAQRQFALPAELKSTSIDKLTPAQQSQWAQCLQMLLLSNKSATFVAAKLKEYQESRVVVLYFVLALLFSLLLTVFVFALANLGLYKIDPTNFSDAGADRFWFFMYYSFNTLVTNSIPDFYPLSGFAMLLGTFEVLLGILTLVILITLYTSVRSERNRAEVDSIIVTLERRGDELEKYISSEFSMDVERAIEEVRKLPGNFIQIIYFFSTKKR